MTTPEIKDMTKIGDVYCYEEEYQGQKILVIRMVATINGQEYGLESGALHKETVGTEMRFGFRQLAFGLLSKEAVWDWWTIKREEGK